jgi:plastocyanin
MRFVTRSVVGAALVGLAFVVGGGGSAGQHVRAQAVKDSARVVMIDSNASFTPGNEYLGPWGFSPAHTAVTKGEQIEFDNPMGNYFPHTVTSITWTGMSPDRVLASGTAFNSSPTREQYLMPGASFVLDTSTLDPGQYVFYCSIHPLMVGSITVEPAS